MHSFQPPGNPTGGGRKEHFLPTSTAVRAIAVAAGVVEMKATPPATEAPSSPGCSTQRTASFEHIETTQAESCASSVGAWIKWPLPKGTLGETIAHSLGASKEQGEPRAVAPGSRLLGAEMAADRGVALGTAAWPSWRTARSGRMCSEAAEMASVREPGDVVARATGCVVGMIHSGRGQVGGVARIA